MSPKNVALSKVFRGYSTTYNQYVHRLRRWKDDKCYVKCPFLGQFTEQITKLRHINNIPITTKSSSFKLTMSFLVFRKFMFSFIVSLHVIGDHFFNKKRKEILRYIKIKFLEYLFVHPHGCVKSRENQECILKVPL